LSSSIAWIFWRYPLLLMLSSEPPTIVWALLGMWDKCEDHYFALNFIEEFCQVNNTSTSNSNFILCSSDIRCVKLL
jgi:hypothetical protein